MASFTPKPIDLSQINGGQEYVNGDMADAKALNEAIEAAAYASEIVENTEVNVSIKETIVENTKNLSKILLNLFSIFFHYSCIFSINVFFVCFYLRKI